MPGFDWISAIPRSVSYTHLDVYKRQEQGYLHRDIKPANLYLRASDHRVILIDFGAARGAVGRQSKSVTSLVTPGYSPPEQYTCLLYTSRCV